MENIDSSGDEKKDVITVSNEYLEFPLEFQEALSQLKFYNIEGIVNKPIEFEIENISGETKNIKLNLTKITNK